MRLRIVHETAYAYDPPASGAIQTLRLTPRGHDGQFVINWRIEVDHDCRLSTTTDPFGNVLQSFTTEGKLDGLVITALGEVETHDMAGMVRGQSERFPISVFLRDTISTQSGPAIRDFAAQLGQRASADPLSRMHSLMEAVNEAIEVGHTEDDSAVATFAEGKGDARAIAHVFIAAARHLGVPARYASGYLHWPEEAEPAVAEHGWAEAFVEGVGWLGFDASMNLCPTDRYVRLAIGLDRVAAAPVRGAAYGDGMAPPKVSIRVTEARAAKR
jgi:transglutaminase-like putative cysteine protease